ncbi:helix-turn-helix domain-containing protein [Kordia sp.]|uniref:helix-turn-helix domain-containing protein n=1 Tax=Kordia sp. TaxID=1965332 RepID=UPI003B5B1B0E
MHFPSIHLLHLRFYVLLVFIFSTNVQAQQIDSLDQYSFNQLNLRFKKTLYKNAELAKLYAQKSLKIAKNKNNISNEVIALINLAIHYDVINESEVSTSYIDQAIDIASDKLQGSKLEARAIFTKGMFSYQRGDYETAFTYYTKAYEFYKNSDDSIFSYGISHNIALIKNVLADHKGALNILTTNYENYIHTPASQRMKTFGSGFFEITTHALSDTYIKLSIEDIENRRQLLDSAVFYNKLGFEVTSKNNDPSVILFHTHKGIISYEQEKFKLALHQLSLSIEEIKKSNYKNLFTSAFYYKAMSFKKLNEIDSAIVYFEKMDSVSLKNSVNYPILQSGYAELVDIYKKRKDRDNAYKYLDLYSENDRINERVTGTVRKDIHEKYDLVLLKNEIKTLNESNFTSLLFIAALITCLGIFFLFYRRQKQKNKIAFNNLVQELEIKKIPELVDEKPKKIITIDDEKVIQVLKGLDKLEAKEWFRNKNCDLTFVAKKTKTNKTYLSKIIHEHKQLKFIDYIRNLRINYALQRLKDDPVFRSYDIKSIAEESGFKSSDMFSRAFIKNTGIYPSYYIKNISKINSSEDN